MRAIGRRGYGLLQAGEAVDEVVNAEQGQDAVDGTVRGNDEPQLAAFCKDALVCRYQGMDGGRVTEPGAVTEPAISRGRRSCRSLELPAKAKAHADRPDACC